MEEVIPFQNCVKCGKDCSESKSVVFYAVVAENLEEDIYQAPIARLCEPCAVNLNDWLFEGGLNEETTP